jgi:hypothetical protein
MLDLVSVSFTGYDVAQSSVDKAVPGTVKGSVAKSAPHSIGSGVFRGQYPAPSAVNITAVDVFKGLLALGRADQQVPI